MRRGIDRVDLVPANRLPVRILAVAEQVLQIIAQLAMHQRIIHTAEFAPEQRRLTQRNGRTDMPGYRQSIDQIQN